MYVLFKFVGVSYLFVFVCCVCCLCCLCLDLARASDVRLCSRDNGHGIKVLVQIIIKPYLLV